MNEFVERCREEWRRLGVPGPLAEEMAADLTSDLQEAEAEGVSAEELLGGSYFDPPAFAATWAGERGIVPKTDAPGSRRRRPPVLVAFTVLAALVVTVAALLLATGEPKVGLTTAGMRPAQVTPAGAGGRTLRTSAAAPIEWVLLVLALAALAFAVWLWSGWARSRAPGFAALRRG